MGIGKFRRGMIAALLVSIVSSTATTTHAEAERSIRDESIYDVLVDRYFNGSRANDYDVHTQDATRFAGGDFTGLIEQADYIKQLGFTTVAIGSVFATTTYDGKQLTSYETLERHFGTQQELQQVVETFHRQQIRVMADVRLNAVSDAHEWLSEQPEWGTVEDELIYWDYTNEAFMTALKQAIVQFQQTYAFGALRLTALDGVPSAFLNEVINELRQVTPHVQIVSEERTDAQVDAMLDVEAVTQWSEMFQQTSAPTNHVEALIESHPIAAVDTLETPRITHKAASVNAFPPTRIKVAMGALLTLPVVPMMTYGTEISMNGADRAASHQLQNFHVDEDIITYIQDIQSVRNRSAALRTGDFHMLYNDEQGFFVFSRSNETETWIVAVNNTDETQHVRLSSDILGSNIELSGLLEKDIVRVDENGAYNIVVDREIVELYQVKEASGFNYTYMGVLAFVYVIFIIFIWMLIRRAKRPKSI